MRHLSARLLCFLVLTAQVRAEEISESASPNAIVQPAPVTAGIPPLYLLIACGIPLGILVLMCVWLFVIVPHRRRGPLRKALAILAANDEAEFSDAEKLLSGVLTAGLRQGDINVARFALAYVRARQRKYSEAAAVLADLKESSPLDREGLYLEAWLQHRLKNYEQVEEIFEEYGERFSDLLDAKLIRGIALLKRARLHWQRREFEKAIHDFDEIRKLEVLADEIPPHLDSHQIVMGIMALRDRDFTEAQSCFKNALIATEKSGQPVYQASLGLLLCAWNNRVDAEWTQEHDKQLDAVAKTLPEKVEPLKAKPKGQPEEKFESESAKNTEQQRDGKVDRNVNSKVKGDVQDEEAAEASDESLDKKLDEATLLIRNVRFWHAMSLVQTCFHLPAKQGLAASQREKIMKRLGVVSKLDPEMPEPFLVAGLVDYYFALDDNQRAGGVTNLRKARDKGVNLPEVLTLLLRIDKTDKFERNQLPAFLAFVKKFMGDRSVPPYLRERLKKYFDQNRRFKTLGEVDIEKGDEDPLGWLGNLQGRCNIVINSLNRHLKPQLAKADPENREKAESLLKALPHDMRELVTIAKKVEEAQTNALVITAQVVFPEEEPVQSQPVDSITFACPHCQKKVRVKIEFAGKKIKCNGCNNLVQIPNC